MSDPVNWPVRPPAWAWAVAAVLAIAAIAAASWILVARDALSFAACMRMLIPFTNVPDPHGAENHSAPVGAVQEDERS